MLLPVSGLALFRALVLALFRAPVLALFQALALALFRALVLALFRALALLLEDGFARGLVGRIVAQVLLLARTGRRLGACREHMSK